jgi:subtilisin family serine protease
LEKFSRQIGIAVFLITSSFTVNAQSNNYLVFFTDKSNSTYSIERPDEFLSQESIERRTNQQIPVVEEDLPVNLNYLQGLETVGNVSVREATKWFNGAIVQATSSEAESLKLLSYVRNVEFIATANTGGRRSKKLDIEDLTNIGSDTLFQFDILGVPEMRVDGFQGENMMVSVLDGGFEGLNSIPAFADLINNNNILLAYDFVSRSNNVFQYSDHGTKVMSLLAANQQAPDYVGVVPNADYLLFVTEDVSYEYRIEEYRWLIAAEKADSVGTDIITSSLGYNIFDDPSMNYNKSQLDGKTAVITMAAQMAATKGILVVTSGGNTGLSDPWETVLFPGDIIDGLAIGSITSDISLSTFSPRGATADGRIKPDLLAQGSATYVINSTGNITARNGTSYSAPLVAGLATGVWQAYPNNNVHELINALLHSSTNSANPDNEWGYGIPSYTAIKNYFTAEESNVWFTAYPNPLETTNFLRIKVFDPILDDNVQVKMFDTLGKPLLDENLSITWQNNEYFLEMTTLPRGIYILNLQSNSNFSQVKILKQ